MDKPIDKVSIRGHIIPRDEYTADPKKFQNTVIIQLDDLYIKSFVNFTKMHPDIFLDLNLTFSQWDFHATERAKKHFFAIRDRIAEADGEISREYKDALYHDCLRELQIYENEGEQIISFSQEISKRDLWRVTQLMLNWGKDRGLYLEDIEAGINDCENSLNQ